MNSDRYDVPGYDTDVLRVVDEMKEEFFPTPGFKVGGVFWHADGYKVCITAGTYWDGDGPERRLSNHWTWHRVDGQGGRIGPDESGYGDRLVNPRMD